ncbi:MAG TPA: hypothetical protein VK564_00110 [Thermodesulfobacteriota bacterium]|nr:hypothetical protein [Thermodesulfobacteriota bacterium]
MDYFFFFFLPEGWVVFGFEMSGSYLGEFFPLKYCRNKYEAIIPSNMEAAKIEIANIMALNKPAINWYYLNVESSRY